MHPCQCSADGKMPQCRAGRLWKEEFRGGIGHETHARGPRKTPRQWKAIKKVPQTPRRQPATNPAVKPPITSPLERKRTPVVSGKSTDKQDLRSGNGKSNASCRNVHFKSCCDSPTDDDELHAAGRFLSDLPTGRWRKTTQHRRALNCSQGLIGRMRMFPPIPKNQPSQTNGEA